MRELPDGAGPRGIDPLDMLQTRIGEYWDSDRATYEDELNAWRDRTAAAVLVGPTAAPARVRAAGRRRVAAPRVRAAGRRRVAARATSPARPLVAPRQVRSAARRREATTILANQPSRDS
jgi:hypothetical protein